MLGIQTTNVTPSRTVARSRWKRSRRWFVLAGLLILLWFSASYYAAYRLTRRAQPLQQEPAPAISWGRVESIRLRTSDGEDLGAWFIDRRADGPVVVLLHGNGGSRSGNLREAELATDAGCSVMLVTLRAHGDSSGELNDIGFSARWDVNAAVDWLSVNHPGRPVVIWGQSLGSAAAIFAAPELGDRVVGYILECTYSDLHTAVRNRTRMYLPPVVEYVAYVGFSTVAPAVLPYADEISPLRAAAAVPKAARVLILSGSADRWATPGEARAIAEALGDRAERAVIEGGDHLQLSDADPAGYRQVVSRFLGRFRRVVR